MRLLAFAGVLCLSFSPVLPDAPNRLANGDFSEGLAGWTTAGNVSVHDGEAILRDLSGDYAALFQAVGLEAGTYLLEFDFLGALSAEVPDLTAADTAFASLYFADGPASFSLSVGGFTAAIGLFDLDFAGVRNLNGGIGPSPKGGVWRRFSTSFSIADGAAVPVFELFADNQIGGDSSLRIDNVYIGRHLMTIPTLGEVGLVVLLAALALLGIVRLTTNRRWA